MTNNNSSPYEILNLNRDFTEEELKKALQNKLNELQNYEGNDKPKKINRILDCYNMLKDAKKRELYDKMYKTFDESNEEDKGLEVPDNIKNDYLLTQAALDWAYTTGNPNLITRAEDNFNNIKRIMDSLSLSDKIIK
jgi:DnaJ-class molecular chaperone